MVDLKDPVIASILVLMISIPVFAGLLHLSSPDWVKRADKNGYQSVYSPLLIAYSVSFSIVMAIAALLVLSSQKKPQEVWEPVVVVPHGTSYDQFKDSVGQV